MADLQDTVSNPFEEEQEYSNPFVSPTTPETNPVYSDTEAALRSAGTSDTPVNSYIESMKRGHKQTMSGMMATGQELSQKALASAVESYVIESGEMVEPEVIAQMQEEQGLNTETSPERLWAEQIDGFFDLSKEQRESIVMRRWTQRQISSIFEEMGIVDVGADVVGLVLVPDETYNSVDFVNKVMGTETTIEGIMNSADALIKLGQVYQRLSPDEQVSLFKEMKEIAKGIDDNELQQMFLLMGATGFTSLGEEQFSQGADKLFVAGAVGKFFSSAMKGTRILKDFARMGATDRVALVADQAAKGTRAPRELQASRIDAASTVMPTTTGELAKIVDQAPTEVASVVRDEWAKMDAIQQEALNFIKESLPLTKADIDRALARSTKAIEDQPNIENLVVRQLDDGMEFTFDTAVPRNEEGVAFFERTTGQKKVVKFTQQDITDGFVNQHGVTTMDDIVSGVRSPNILFRGEREFLVQAFERIANAQAKVKSRLTDSLRLATKGLSKVSQGNIERVLFQGDKDGIIYKYHDLVIEGVGGVRLTDKEYISYAKTRKVLDDMWILKNKEVVDGLTVRNAKLVKTSDSQEGYASVLEDAVAAKRKYSSESDFRRVYDSETDSILDSLSAERIDELYNDGFILTKLDNTADFWNAAEKRTKWALVRREDISDLPTNVLNYKTGYVPRIYDDAYYFVKATDGVVEGKSTFKTLRYFNNKTDASAFRAQLIAEGRDPKEILEPLFSREPISDTELNGDTINMFGGLFSSPRGQETLSFGLKGEDAKLVEPLQAIQQYMFHLGNRIPVSQYKLGMQQKWINEAQKFLGTHPGTDFTSTLSKVVESTKGDPKERKFLIKSHEQIDSLSHVPSRDDQILQGKFISIGNSLEAKSPALKGAARWMYSLHQKNPVNAVKAATHHALLGTYSIAQFPIQALGATVAFSINPKYAARGASKWLAFHYLDNIRDPAVKAAQLKKLSTSVDGLSDIEDAYRLWNRSGYRESVLVTNGDYASIANGLPYDGNLVKRAFDKGTFFFKAGEMANMRISFATSMERWKDLNPGKLLDDEALKQIFARSEQFRLNMGQGNRARFQKGAISIPLQFQQINTKFFEAIGAGSAFTRSERARLLVGQGTLFGAMGIPLGQQAVSYMADAMDLDTSGVSPEQLNTAKRGVVGWTVNNLLGIDAEISGRVAIAGGLTDMVSDMIFEKHSILGVAGPAGAVAERFWNGPLDVVMHANKMVISAEDLDISSVGLIAENLLWSLGEIPSSSRNAIIANDLWRTGLVRTSNGKVLWATDPKVKDIIFQSMGFQSVDKQEFYELLMSDRGRAETEKILVDRLSRVYTRLLRSATDGDGEQAEAAAKTIAVLQSYIEDEETSTRVAKQLMERFRVDDDKLNLLQKALKSSNDYSTKASDVFSILKQEAISGEL